MSRSRCSGLALVVFLVVGVSSASAQNVYVVDAGGSGDFTALQPAVDAAATGDVLLLRSDLPVGAFIDGKGLTIAGDMPDRADVGELHVLNVPAGATFTLRHVRVVEPANHFQAIEAHDNAGTIVMEDVFAQGQFGSAFMLAAVGLKATNCASLVLNNSFFYGGTGEPGSPFWSPFAGMPGLTAVDCQVSATWTEFRGGAGATGIVYGTAPPGSGIDATGSYLFLSGCEVIGGANPDCGLCGSGSYSSDGLHLTSGLVQYVDCVFQAGTPGLNTPPGEGIDAAPGTAQDLGGIRRALFASSPLHFSATGILIYEGAAHDLVGVFSSPITGFLPIASKAGVWQLAAPVAGPLLLGMANSTGHLKVNFHAPDITPLEGVTMFLQVAAVDAVSGLLRISGPATITLLAPTF
jgi:hypothetical protein